jgi:MoxR-like ATPase
MSQFSATDPTVERELELANKLAVSILEATGERVIGQQHLRRRLVQALITGGHILLEGVPGLGKTLSIHALADCVDGKFSRIQFTPDLLPADLVGTEIYRPQTSSFEVRQGPVFANFVLADEINRAPAKVQSALLETMQERQVTIGSETFNLPTPFLVLATQNPIDQEGTYPLPEAQVDRFMMKVKVSYPSPEEERKMLDRVTQSDPYRMAGKKVCTLSDVLALQKVVGNVYVDPKIRKYIVDLVGATRDPEYFKIPLKGMIELGASPRSTISLFALARAEAFLNGETYVVPQNVKDAAYDVLRHRVIPSYEAEAKGMTSESIIDEVLRGVAVP